MNARTWPIRGQTLILVLWIMGILTVAMGTLIVRSTHELRLGQMPLLLIQRQAIAQAGVSLAAGLIKQDDPAIDHLGEAWATGVDPSTQQQLFENKRVGEGAFSVGVTENGQEFHAGLIDEQRKLNVNTAAPEQLKRLIEEVAPNAPAAELSAAIADWRDEPLGEYCKTASPPCHNAPLDTVDELRLVPGMTPEIMGAVEPYVTVYGTGLVNVNTASVAVLNALGGEGENWAQQRKNKPFESSPNADIPNLAVTSSHFTVCVQASQNGSMSRIEAVIDRDGRILSWLPQ